MDISQGKVWHTIIVAKLYQGYGLACEIVANPYPGHNVACQTIPWDGFGRRHVVGLLHGVELVRPPAKCSAVHTIPVDKQTTRVYVIVITSIVILIVINRLYWWQ